MTKLPQNYSSFDTTQYLHTEEDIRDFICAAIDENSNDLAYLNHVLNVAAKARGMQQLAKDTGVTRQALYKALSPDGNPQFSTILKIINALGLRFRVEPVQQ